MIAKKFLFHQPEDTRFLLPTNPLIYGYSLGYASKSINPTTPAGRKKDKPAIRTKKAFRYKTNGRPSYFQAD